MTIEELKKYFKSGYNFRKITGMSACTFGNWLKWGYVPTASQFVIERITKGDLKADWDEK